MRIAHLLAGAALVVAIFGFVAVGAVPISVGVIVFCLFGVAMLGCAWFAV